MKYIYHSPNPELLSESMKDAVYTTFFRDAPGSVAMLAPGVSLDIAKAPHVLIAGATGSGKSCLMHNIICSLLIKNTPLTARFLLIDPKMVEMEFFYKDNPCLYCPVVTDPSAAARRLEQVETDMMDRYSKMKRDGKRLWDGAKLYIFIDELVDLLAYNDRRIRKSIERIARLGRGAGIHLILATQHPDSKTLSRQITANIDTQICMRVRDYHASKLVIGKTGGEQLKGKGDAIMYHDGEYKHFQASYIDDASLESFCRSWTLKKKQYILQDLCLNIDLTGGK